MTSYTRYRHLAIGGAKAPPTPTEIAAIEKLLGASLPAPFLDYLQVANGGFLEYFVDVPGDGRTDELSFSSLFSTARGTSLDGTFVGEIRAGRELMKIPPGVLPFARDGGGSSVYLDLSTEGAGRVVAFVHGLPAWAGRRIESAYVELASSFVEYVDRLRLDREAALDHLTHDVEEREDLEALEEWLDIGSPGWRESDAALRTAAKEARRRLGRGEAGA